MSLVPRLQYYWIVPKMTFIWTDLFFPKIIDKKKVKWPFFESFLCAFEWFIYWFICENLINFFFRGSSLMNPVLWFPDEPGQTTIILWIETFKSFKLSVRNSFLYRILYGTTSIGIISNNIPIKYEVWSRRYLWTFWKYLRGSHDIVHFSGDWSIKNLEFFSLLLNGNVYGCQQLIEDTGV